jgi:hypothetical protein
MAKEQRQHFDHVAFTVALDEANRTYEELREARRKELVEFACKAFDQYHGYKKPPVWFREGAERLALEMYPKPRRLREVNDFGTRFRWEPNLKQIQYSNSGQWISATGLTYTEVRRQIFNDLEANPYEETP